MVITAQKGSITITADLHMNELLDLLNEHTDSEDFQDTLLEVMPKDYEYLTGLGEVLFACGSEQVMMCGWKFTYEIDDAGCKLTISNLK